MTFAVDWALKNNYLSSLDPHRLSASSEKQKLVLKVEHRTWGVLERYPECDGLVLISSTPWTKLMLRRQLASCFMLGLGFMLSAQY